MPTGKPTGGVATRATAPVALEGLTVMVKVAELPWVIGLGPEGPVSVTVSAVKETPDQALTKLLMLREPRPVALSYPVVVMKAGVLVFVGSRSTPNCEELVLLQFGVPPWQATELFPRTVS